MKIEDKDVKERDLDYFMGLKYDVLMKKVNDGYCAFIPELSLFAEGKSASDAFEKIEQEKEQYFKRVLAVDAGDTVSEPLAVTRRKRFKEDILLFGAKTLVVGVIFGIIVSVLLPSIDIFVSTRINRINQMINQIDPVKYMEITVGKVDKRISSMSEKEREDTRIKLRKMVQKIKPFADEVRILFDGKNESKIGLHAKHKDRSLSKESNE